MSPQHVIHQVLKDWAVLFVHNRIQGAQGANLVASGALTRQMRFEVTSALRDVKAVFFAFEEYGRILEMKGVNRKRQIPIDEIVAWVKDKGLDEFRAGFRRRHRRLPTSQTQLLNQIAWGIAMKRLRSKRLKRRKWYSKDRESDFDLLYRRLMDALADNTIKSLKENRA